MRGIALVLFGIVLELRRIVWNCAVLRKIMQNCADLRGIVQSAKKVDLQLQLHASKMYLHALKTLLKLSLCCI